MIAVDALYLMLVLYGLCCSLYLALLTAAAPFYRKKAAPGDPVLTVAVLVPAHDEQAQIAETIQRLKASDYPARLFEVFVIADNCSDRTAQSAEAAGARVLVRTDTAHRGKGQALDWFFRSCRPAYADFDLVAIVDADTSVAAGFLRQAAATLACPGVDAVQGFYGVSNPGENWRSALSAAALNVFHHLRPAGRCRIGGSAGLRGNGMVFKTQLLAARGWPAHSIVEDLEFSLQLLADGVTVAYNPDAAVFAEMATRAGQAETQRRRWEGGRIDIARRHVPRLVSRWWRRREPALLDGLLDLLTPPLSVFVAGQALLLLGAIFHYTWAWSPAALGLAVAVAYVAAGQVLRRAPAYVWGYLLAAPVFVLWKLTVYLGMLRRPVSGVWQRTTRRSEMAAPTRQQPPEKNR